MRTYVLDATTEQQKEEAAGLIDKLIAEMPESAGLHQAHAELLSGLDDAEAKLTAAIEEYPRQADYYLKRAKVFDTQGASEKALADYVKAVELGDDSYYTRYRRALCCPGADTDEPGTGRTSMAT